MAGVSEKITLLHFPSLLDGRPSVVHKVLSSLPRCQQESSILGVILSGWAGSEPRARSR